MTKYRELQKLVYSIIFPEGIPIEFGVEFISKEAYGDDSILFFCSIYDDTGNTRTLSYMSPDKEMTSEIFDFDSFKGDFTVLGKPLQGFDILSAIYEKKKVELWDWEVYSLWRKCFNSLINIVEPSKPIKELSDETLQKLINLIK